MYLLPISGFLKLSFLCSSIFIITACGGGASSENSNQNNIKPLEPSTPNKNLLAETKNLPQLPENSNPLQSEGDAEAIKALQEGVYTMKTVTLHGSADEVSECPSGGKVYCASVDKYKFVNGKIEGKTWTYLPKSKKWIELSTSNANQFESPLYFGDLYSDGKKWFKDGLDLHSTKATIKNNKISYQYGEANFSFLGFTVSLTDFTDVLEFEVNYSQDAQGYLFMFKLDKGEYLSLLDSKYGGTYYNNGTYPNLAKFRETHTKSDSPLCFLASSWNEAIVFNAKKTGVSLYSVDSICNGVAKPTSIILEEGVKTIDNRQVIYLSQQKEERPSFEETSSAQFLWAISLDDNGSVIQGTAYQPGYGELLPDLVVNKKAILDWLIQDYQYDSKLALP